ncbi:hypothetical protein ACFL54_04280 [Planctomycetota bacterium]
MMKSKMAKPGFTLIELVVVIGIVILITCLMVPMAGISISHSGVQAGGRVVQGVLLNGRSLAVNLRRKIVVVFELSAYPADPSVYGGDHRNPDSTEMVDALAEYYTGKMVLYDIAQPSVQGGGPVACQKVPGEFVLPKNSTFSYSPHFCVFLPDGSMQMGFFSAEGLSTGMSSTAAVQKTSFGSDGDAIPFNDASSSDFERYVAENVRTGEMVDNHGTAPEHAPYDLKIICKGGGGKTYFANLVSLSGRAAKWIIGPRIEK